MILVCCSDHCQSMKLESNYYQHEGTLTHVADDAASPAVYEGQVHPPGLKPMNHGRPGSMKRCTHIKRSCSCPGWQFLAFVFLLLMLLKPVFMACSSNILPIFNWNTEKKRRKRERPCSLLDTAVANPMREFLHLENQCHSMDTNWYLTDAYIVWVIWLYKT